MRVILFQVCPELPVFDPVDANSFYAFASGGIFKSSDRGDSWQVLFEPKTSAFGEWKLLINPDNPDTASGMKRYIIFIFQACINQVPVITTISAMINFTTVCFHRK
jgi:hypothetical protein